jgi:hydroxymethylbilane synthase
LATRGSELAIKQAGWVKARLEQLGEQVSLVFIETQGDREQQPFAAMGGSGFFTKAVQEALLDGRADLAVHSYKDLPSHQTPGLEVAAVPECS